MEKSVLDQQQPLEGERANTDSTNKSNGGDYALVNNTNAEQNSETDGSYSNTLQQQYDDGNQFIFSMLPPNQQSNTNDAAKYNRWKEYQSDSDILSQYDFTTSNAAAVAAAAAASAVAPHPYDTLQEQQQQQHQQQQQNPFTPHPQQPSFLADSYNYSPHRGSLPVIYDPNLLSQQTAGMPMGIPQPQPVMPQPTHLQMIDQNHYARRHTEGSLPVRNMTGGRKARASTGTGTTSAGNSRRNSKATSTTSGDGGVDDEDEEAKRRQFLERNRQAALKCRQRKKQWLANLQNRVEFLSADNEQLQSQATMLREEIINLKTLLLAHRDCKVAQANGATVDMIQNASSHAFHNIPLGSSTLLSSSGQHVVPTPSTSSSTPIFNNSNVHPHQPPPSQNHLQQ